MGGEMEGGIGGGGSGEGLRKDLGGGIWGVRNALRRERGRGFDGSTIFYFPLPDLHRPEGRTVPPAQYSMRASEEQPLNKHPRRANMIVDDLLSVFGEFILYG